MVYLYIVNFLMVKIFRSSVLVVVLLFSGGGVFAQNISINTTGAAANSLNMLEILQLSTTADSKGLYILHSGATTGGSGYGYGLWAEKTGSGAASLNVGSNSKASGGTLYNIGAGGNATGSGTEQNIGGYFLGTGLGTTTNYGVYGEANATGLNGNNIAGYFTASGATGTGKNYAILVPAAKGLVGIGTITPTMQLHVVGTSTTANDAVILGNSTGASGQVFGVLGQVVSNAGNASGVKGYASGATTSSNGVWGDNASTSNNASGVFGSATGVTAAAATFGVFGTTVSTFGTSSGVYGEASGLTGSIYGVNGVSRGDIGIGVFGKVFHATGANFGVYGLTSSSAGTGVYGHNNSTTAGTVYGVYGIKSGAMGAAGTGYGVYGTSTGTAATNIAGYFTASGATANYGVIVPAAGGNSGFGTLTPAAVVSVVGTSQNTLSVESPAYPEITFRVSGTIKSYDAIATSAGGYTATSGVGDRVYRAEAGNHLFCYGATELMRVTTAGNVGIGTAAPTNKLQVVGGDNVTTGPIMSLAGAAPNQIESGRIRFQESNNAGVDGFLGGYIQYDGSVNKFFIGVHNTADQLAASDAVGMTILRSNAFVGIGITAPTSRLHVETSNAGGNIALFNNTSSGGTMSVNGNPAVGRSNVDAEGTPTTAGTSYNPVQVNSIIFGQTKVGSPLYSFGIYGSTTAAAFRTGGVIGSATNTDWGALGYLNSGGTIYALYTTAAGFGSGTGRVSSSSAIIERNIGIGVNGGLFAGLMKGSIYGLNVKGERYSMYIDGKTYTNNVIAQLAENGDGERIVSYIPTSTSVDVYTKGIAKLSQGRVSVRFDTNYRKIISLEAPVIVTVTPMGKSSGVYLESVSSEGFTVVENNNGNSNLPVSWIAVSTRKGYEQPNTPVELLSPQYDGNMDKVMFNENNTQDSALPIWWDGKKLRFDGIPVKQRTRIPNNTSAFGRESY